MIECIQISECASYRQQPQQMDPLSVINFVYGSNGAGKTTISRLIEDPSTHPSCSISWKRGTELEARVYNRDFVDSNFNQGTDLKGIFTLGQRNIETENKIKEAKLKIDTWVHKIEQLTNTMQGNDGTGGKIGELAQIEARFTEECWNVKLKHSPKLQGALSGYLNSKEKFKAKLISECKAAAPQSPALSELETRAASVFGPAPMAEPLFPIPNASEFLAYESDPILEKRIIGKTDVDIAAMIQKLGNSDWVKQGMRFLEMSDGNCPFCQQVTPEKFKASLEEYFDESFTRDTSAISRLRDGYKLEGERLQKLFQTSLSSESRFLDAEKLKSDTSNFDSRFHLNQQKIETKVKEPSQIIALEPVTAILKSASQIISDANQKVQSHNSMVANLSAEKAKLARQVWAYFAQNEIAPEFARYQAQKANVERAIDSLRNQISMAERDKATEEAEIRNLERSTTSIQPTVNDINKILKEFGFRNFSIAATTTNHYRILRPDGSEAQQTLSEGERGFLTFLYFYHLLKGSNTDSGMTRDRIVVFDDPVSSLDSDVLFIVSSLIRKLIEDVRGGRGHIKQVFVLTHNVYFHKEVTFDKTRTGDTAKSDETFWTIQKVNDLSTIQKHQKNPVTTTYNLLWAEVRNPNSASVTLPNTLRRILESYFRILGGIGPDEILAHFEGEEKIICRSLLSWINDGSHSVADDIFVTADASVIEKYRDVFKKIFFKLQHHNHYNMMMGTQTIESTVTSPPPISTTATIVPNRPLVGHGAQVVTPFNP